MTPLNTILVPLVQLQGPLNACGCRGKIRIWKLIINHYNVFFTVSLWQRIIIIVVKEDLDHTFYFVSLDPIPGDLKCRFETANISITPFIYPVVQTGKEGGGGGEG